MLDTGVRRKTRMVLLVEDDPIVQEVYGDALQEAGLLVESVVTVDDAIARAFTARPDIIVLDRHLPDGDGWEVARRVKHAESLSQIPIIAFTSNLRGRADVEAALVAGCDVFLEKPCTPEALVRHVFGLLELALPEDDIPTVRPPESHAPEVKIPAMRVPDMRMPLRSGEIRIPDAVAVARRKLA